MKPAFDIRAHFDSVRDLHFIPSLHTLASVSEDCQVKLWNLKNLKDIKAKQHLQAHMTIRGHPGSIFAITGPSLHSDNSEQQNEALSRLLFTGGAEGAIKAWHFPKDFVAKDYPETKGKNFCVGTWTDGQEEPVWQIEYHPFLSLLVAIKSDASVQLWDCGEVVEAVKGEKEDFKVDLSAPLKTFSFEQESKEQVATACAWLPTDHNLLAVGYESSQVVFFDHTSSRIEHTFELPGEPSPVQSIVAHSLKPLIAVGTRSGKVFLIDFKAQKVVETLTVEEGSEGVYI